MKKQPIQITIVILFTITLCLVSINEETSPEKITNTEGNAASIHFSSTECEPRKPDEQLQPASSIVTPQEEVQLDKDALLSAVNGLPENEGIICSSLDILQSPQAKKVQDIVQHFYENDLNISFIVLDLNTGNYFSLNPGSPFYSASTIKGPYVAALNKFSPEIVDEYTESMMENTIQWSSNEDYENLHYLYGNDVMYEMTEYTDVSSSIIDEYNWYPYLTAKELTKLWVGTYVYFFEDTNENSKWCQSLYIDSTESFINSALNEEYTVYTKPGWYSDWEDVSRNDAGIVMADGHDYVLTIMSDAFDSYDNLETLAGSLDNVHGLLYIAETDD